MELHEVPAGPFLMGSSDADEMAFSDEKPQHEVTLATFKIGKYPVTNRQYAAFVEDAPPEGWEDHPVVYVSWHEALAFCRWLTEAWQAEGRIGKDEVVRLPSEAEWEKAARGDDGRRYPWGDNPDPNKANYGASGIGGTSVVGRFPGGASPYGCQDMSGNVWEWTYSVLEFYPYDPKDGREDPGRAGGRVVRGGAFDRTVNLVRCALRLRYPPDFGNFNLGFRVVVAVAA